MIRAYGNNVVVLFDCFDPKHPDHPSNRKTPGGLFIPQTVENATPVETVNATVFAAGPGHTNEHGRWVPMNPDIVPGARVLIEGKKHAAILVGQPYFQDGLEYRIVRDYDIGGVIEEDEAAE